MPPRISYRQQSRSDIFYAALQWFANRYGESAYNRLRQTLNSVGDSVIESALERGQRGFESWLTGIYPSSSSDLLAPGSKRRRDDAYPVDTLHPQDIPMSEGYGAIRRRVVNTSGTYIGPFKKPKRASRPGKYAISGFRGEHEMHGNKQEADCLYFGFTSVVPRRIGIAVGVALLRSIMKRHFRIEYCDARAKFVPYKAGLPPNAPVSTSVEQPLHSIGFISREDKTNAPEYEVPVILHYDPTGTAASSDTIKFFTDQSTLLDVAMLFADYVFCNPRYGGGEFISVPGDNASAEDYKLHGYQVTEKFVVGNQIGYRPLPVVRLDTQYVKAYSTVRMHIQNVSVADDADAPSGGAFLSTRIDANPIKGALFKFHEPVPRVKNPLGGDGSNTAVTSLRLQNESEVLKGTAMQNDIAGLIRPTGLNQSWTQIPECDMFANCSGYRNISLDPGTMRDFALKFSFDGLLTKLMWGLREWGRSGEDWINWRPTLQYGNLGTSMLFALEKRMPTGEANVAINWHYENFYGACLKKSVRQTFDKFALPGINVA